MIRLNTVAEFRSWRNSLGEKAFGLVPTMGALHEGHMELVRRSCNENSATAVSIFINPVQFNDPRDCISYPSPLEKDLDLCRNAGVTAVFLPIYRDIYPDNYVYRVEETENGSVLEGESRPGHFTGVLTVVLKLLILARANRAYFGEKDWQQLQLVTGLAKAFLLETEIVPVPTIRAEDGLALASRNERLTSEGRKLAPEFYRVLNTAIDCAMARHELKALGFEVEYIDERDGRRLGAVQIGGVRLIDNVPAKGK